MLASLGSQLRGVSAAAVLPLFQRGIAAASDPGPAQQAAQTAAVGAGLIEMRDYTIKPVRMQATAVNVHDTAAQLSQHRSATYRNNSPTT